MPWLSLLLALAVSQNLPDQIRAAQAAGNYAEAANLYGQLIAGGIDSPEIRSNYGIMLQLSGKPRQSLEQLHLALHRNPNMAAANLFAGMAEFDLREYRAALPYLKRAVELDAAHTPPLLAQAKTYVALREYSQANSCYSKAVLIDPNLAEAWYGAGVTYRSQADEILNRASRTPGLPKDEAMRLLDKALNALGRATSLDPNSARTHLITAESLADTGRLPEAVEEYQNAARIDPSLTAARLGLATAYWKQAQLDDALRLVQQVLTETPKDPEAHGILADILEHKNDLEGAKTHAELALAGNPNLLETRVVLARIYLTRKQPALAVAQLNKIISADPDGNYHFLLFRAYRAMGDEKAARSALAEFRRLRGTNAPSDADAVGVPAHQP